jgi:acetaldehyde dehydrogenase
MVSARAPLAAILGSGNIGTDLLVKMLRARDSSPAALHPLLMCGIDAASDGLARAKRMGVETTDRGIDGLLAHVHAGELAVVFDATSAKAHHHHAARLAERGIAVVDMTPAAVGPLVVPVVNGAAHAHTANVNLVTCGGQATIPMVAAINEVTPVVYAEIVASIASKSAGPGTRANIDEFTQTTARGLEVVGGAQRGKAIIVLNPADPPVIMRDTVQLFCAQPPTDARVAAWRASVDKMVTAVAAYVPGYRLVQAPVCVERVFAPPGEASVVGTHISIFLEVEGAGHYLPKYAGNLDIMTSAALRMGQMMAEARA